eukprot:TRINITY_DN686_c0_g1_i1.p1 TRINITY_DN686_c0_g1~~TRINITY_DN686_c0_g1_i1.p1  ORF type:complete len:119 (+),score=58.56 TRINITY_DN686_c0_g1_i1:136-492(+)
MADLSGVTKLFEAEQKAKELIDKAYQEKNQKLKEARVAAEKELEIFRREEEEKFEAEVKRRYGKEQESDDLEATTNEEIQSIRRDYETNKKKVVELLIERVVTVDLEFPQVLKGNYNI